MGVIFVIGIFVDVFDGENVVSVVFCFTPPLEIISVISFGSNCYKVDGGTRMIVGKLSRCKT